MSRVTTMLESVRERLSDVEQAELADLIYERLGGFDIRPEDEAKIRRALDQKSRGEGVEAREFFKAFRERHNLPPR